MGTAVCVHQEGTCPSSGAFHIQALCLFIMAGHMSLQWLIVLCSCLCVSKRAAMYSLHADVSLLGRFKITFKKLPTSKVTKYFWMAQGMIANLWFTSDAGVWASANKPDCTTSCQCQLQKFFASESSQTTPPW